MDGAAWNALSDADRAEFWASLALKHTQGIGPRTCIRLLRRFGSAYAALENKEFWLEAGVSKEKARLLASGSWRTTALQEWQNAQICGAHILLWSHKAYPDSLRQLIDAPPILYYHGDISLLTAPCFAIVGSRHCSAEGVQVAGSVARELSAAGISVVSGMAQGIDRVAHAAALAHVGKSIAVLGTGIDVIYPKNNEDIYHSLCGQGLVITEFAPHTGPLATHFPIRNRIVSGLSLGVLVVEGTLNSGSLITARLALEQNREVYAIPGAATAANSRGCQELIRQGAKPVFNGDDILQDLALRLQEYVSTQPVTTGPCDADIATRGEAKVATKGESFLSGASHEAAKEQCQIVAAQACELEGFSEEDQEDVRVLLLHLHSCGDDHVDALCAVLNKPIAQINTLLIEMELCGFIKKLPGARYKAARA